MSTIQRGLWALLWCVAIASAGAQERDTTAYTLPAVTVETDQPTITTAPVKTERISAKDLKKAACCSLAESFEKNPSVEVSFADAVTGARQIQLLGLRGMYTQFLVEAVPLVRGPEMPFGLDHIPGPFMESISISKGTSTVTTGYEAITGQINVCLHDPQIADALFVNLYGNTMHRFEGNVYTAAQLSDELSTMTLAHGRIMDVALDNNNDGFADIPTFNQLNLVHRWRFNNDEIEWQVFVRGLVDNYESGQSVLGSHASTHDHNNPLAGTPYDVATSITRFDGFVKFGVLEVFESMPNSGVSLTVSGAYNDLNSTFGTRTASSMQRTASVKGVVSAPFTSTVKLVGGFSYMYDDVQEGVMDNAFARQEHVPGLYAEVTLQPASSLTILAGLRADAHNLYGTRVVPRAHVKWMASNYVTVRASGGRGWRVANVVSENLGSYVNSRQLFFSPSFEPEDAWNVGGSITSSFEVDERLVTVDVELYSTQFTNQIVVDYDRSVRELWITNLDGKSYATNAMVQVLTSPLPRFDVLVAYRWVDVQSPYGGAMQQRALISRSRVLATLSYAVPSDTWQFDATVAWNGGGRFPTTEGNAAPDTRPTTFPSFWRVSGQATYRMGNFDVYAGVENALNYIQHDPILGASLPYGESFDASLAWGPLDSRMVYAGVRWRMNQW